MTNITRGHEGGASASSDGQEFKSLHCAAEIRRRRPLLSSPPLFSSEIFPEISPRPTPQREVERESDARAACKNPKGHSFFLPPRLFIAHLHPRHRARARRLWAKIRIGNSKVSVGDATTHGNNLLVVSDATNL